MARADARQAAQQETAAAAVQPALFAGTWVGTQAWAIKDPPPGASQDQTVTLELQVVDGKITGTMKPFLGGEDGATITAAAIVGEELRATAVIGRPRAQVAGGGSGSAKWKDRIRISFAFRTAGVNTAGVKMTGTADLQMGNVPWAKFSYDLGKPQSPPDAAEQSLRAAVAAAPRLTALAASAITVPGVELGMVSWVASAKDGTVYLLQRGDKADPVIAIDRAGKMLRSWGKNRYVMPHAIRVDPQGNVWTTDAASSHVTKYSSTGQVLLDIEIGGQPSPCRNNFCGTTDIAFAANGHLFISDGYANARILEYSADGKKLAEWGTPGSGPGQFVLPHSIQIDPAGLVYVADRENGRVQRFDQKGKYVDEWVYGKTFGLKADGGFMWLATQPLQQPNLSPGWLLKVDTRTGRIAGWAPSAGNHGMDVTASGDLLLGPGPNLLPQRYATRR
ncbi:MAG TPA: peptidyl-alpha-hydroxyglycine alpha-amidating lyase family protein [Thermoanaerobaculia bacterium]|nr:peptidyl-alpha-hydroxyglycine alpha-amidating lyase family protein [Thermoanaerobaculia bacterium]